MSIHFLHSGFAPQGTCSVTLSADWHDVCGKPATRYAEVLNHEYGIWTTDVRTTATQLMHLCDEHEREVAASGERFTLVMSEPLREPTDITCSESDLGEVPDHG